MANTRANKSKLPPPQPPSGVIGLDTASDRFHLYGCGLTVSAHAKKSWSADDRREVLYTRARQAFMLLPAKTLIVCEEPLALKNGKTTRILCLAAGAIWTAHLGLDVYWFWADVAAWKSRVLGLGANAKKEQIEQWVRENLGLHFDEQDFYDAVCLQRYGEALINAVDH